MQNDILIKTQIFFYNLRRFIKTFQLQRYILALLLGALYVMFIPVYSTSPNRQLSIPFISPIPFAQRQDHKNQKEVFGFAPWWNFRKLDNVDFSTLTTLAFFGVEVDREGNLDRQGDGYQTFIGQRATQLFTKAHQNGVRVVLTITQMDNDTIEAFLDNESAQESLVREVAAEVRQRGIDGINIDFEYTGRPETHYKNKFSKFVSRLSTAMHSQDPLSYVTVSVYASSAKDGKLYDIANLASSTDSIFMMAYDFATTSADNAIPTAPLYGHKEGKYWYDIATAVNDFLKVMPEEKLILGVPWYGYNYLVYSPGIKAETRPYWSWRGQPKAQTYSAVLNNINEQNPDISNIKKGWDNLGKVGWIAYVVNETDTWRMIFAEDERSLGIKYDFAINKNLAGVGIWALGFDEGKSDMWALLKRKFGTKLANNILSEKAIQ